MTLPRKAPFARWASIALVQVLSVTLPAQELLHAPGEGMGANPVPASRNRWAAKIISAAVKPTDADYVDDLELDFFALEYGRAFGPCAFEVKDERGSEWKKLFEGIRLGRGWGHLELGRYTLIAEIEQNVDESEWSFMRYQVSGNRGATGFKVKGDGGVKVRVNLGMIRDLEQVKDVAIICSTPGAKGVIRSLRIVPTRLPVEWRKTFVLDRIPFRAAITVPTAEVTVNGRRVFPASIGGSTEAMKADILPLLRTGTNEIVVARNLNSGYGLPPANLSFTEAFYVTDEGRTVRLGADSSWQYRFGTGSWSGVVESGRVGEERIASGMAVCHRGGRICVHAGPLDVRPATVDGYPLFDEDAKVAWKISLPPGLKNPKVTCEVRDALTGRSVAIPACEAAGLEARLPVGAYEFRWRLEADGGIVDTDLTEGVVIGRIPQDEFAFADFEDALKSRLELLGDIDCTAEPAPDTFLDHSSAYVKSATGLGKVTAIGPFRCRVTGPGQGDFFSYAIPVGTLGAPHIVEIEFPDVDERVLCTSIHSTFPNDYCYNKLPGGVSAMPQASGSVRTGGIMPVSGQLRRLRTVFFPGSSNTTYTVENQLAGAGAPVSRIRVYEVKGGLPALKLPGTGRLYANHCERPLWPLFGTYVNPAISHYTGGLYEKGWTALFAAAANRVRQLRFAGENAAIEGVYMYREQFPTYSGESVSVSPDCDPFLLYARLCAKNGIRVFPCFEYMKAPKLNRAKGNFVSNRELAAGSARGIYCVDGQGRQAVGYMGAGLNYLAPEVWGSITNLLTEIYARYNAVDGIEGLFTVNGMWWLPGIPNVCNLAPDDIGYDDDTYELFVRQTGRDLGPDAAKGPGRFAVRKAKLTGELIEVWHAWRAKHLRDSIAALARITKGGKHDWKIFPTPHITFPGVTPFNRIGATKAERDGYVVERMKEAGFDPSLYIGDGADGDIVLVPEVSFEHNHRIERYGAMLSEGSKDLYRRTGSVYFSPIGLNEHFGLKSSGLKKWWWRENIVTVYDVKPAGRNAFYDFVDVLSATSPKYMFHTWLDVNLTTAHAEEARRFAAGFISTPLVDLRPADAVRGVSAFVGKGVVQLVNATPYEVAGELHVKSGVIDALTGREVSGSYRLPPWGVTALIGEDAESTTGAFSFDSRQADRIRDEVTRVLDTPALAAGVDPSTLARLSAARKSGDLYAQARLLRDIEILDPVARFETAASGLAGQRRLLELLAKDGVVRIECGGTTDIVDELGRLWLADQRYTGFSAWGNQHGRYVDRGAIEIRNTKTPSVYRTECGAAVGLEYDFPLPEGEYEFVLHFAETWDKTPGRQMYASVNGGEWRFIDVWGKAFGRCGAMQESWKGVRPEKGLVVIRFKGNSILNGIEIFRARKESSDCGMPTNRRDK